MPQEKGPFDCYLRLGCQEGNAAVLFSTCSVQVFYLRQHRWPRSHNNSLLNVSVATVFIKLEETTFDYHCIHWGSPKD